MGKKRTKERKRLLCNCLLKCAPHGRRFVKSAYRQREGTRRESTETGQGVGGRKRGARERGRELSLDIACHYNYHYTLIMSTSASNWNHSITFKFDLQIASHRSDIVVILWAFHSWRSLLSVCLCTPLPLPLSLPLSVCACVGTLGSGAKSINLAWPNEIALWTGAIDRSSVCVCVFIYVCVCMYVQVCVFLCVMRVDWNVVSSAYKTLDHIIVISRRVYLAIVGCRVQLISGNESATLSSLKLFACSLIFNNFSNGNVLKKLLKKLF